MKTTWFLLNIVAILFLIAPDISQAAVGTNTDLAIGKTASTSTANVGDVLSFQLSVTNLGPVFATAAVVADVLPSGLYYLSSSGSGTYNPATGQWNFVPGAPGGISILTITVQATNAGNWLNSAVITVSVPADANPANNTASASVTVSAVTNTNPPIVLTCPTNITVTATSSNGVVVFFTSSATGGCNPPPFVSSTPPSGSTFPIGTTTVTTTASDNCGTFTNCSFTVTVYPPLNLTCSTNITVTATSTNGAFVFFSTTATGGCTPPPVIVSASKSSGSLFPVGVTSVFVYAVDNCGNSNNCSFTVTVNPPLTITCPTNITVTATGAGGATVFYTVTASGGCSPPPFVSASPPSGSTFPIGTTTVNSTASDTCSNSANCSFTVTVVRPPISLTCSSNLTVTATSSNGMVVFYTVTATGGCSPPPFVFANPPSGSTFPIGTTTVTTTASDNCGTATNCSFTVTVIPPLILTCSSNITVTATSSNGAFVFFSTTVTGGCTPPPVIVSASKASGSLFPVGVTSVFVYAVDNCGNSNNCSFTVTVNPPVSVNCPSNITVTATSSGGATVFYTVTASGGCSPPPFVNSTPPSGSTFPIGTTTVNSTASDTCGNSASCSFTVTVNPQADLRVTKFGPADPVTVGQNITYTIVVTNAGPNTASNIISRDAIPTGTDFVSATPPGYTYYPNFLRVDTAPFTLAAGGIFTWTVTVQVTNAEQIINAANAYGSTPDPNTTNNVGWATNTAVNPAADLSVTKSGLPVSVLVGQNLTYTIVVSNAGPNTASNIISRDAIPTGTDFVSATPPGHTYYPNFLRVDTAPFTLAAGGIFTWTVTVQVTNAEQIINAANAYGDTPDPNTTNNLGWATNTAVNPSADLSVTKTASSTNAPTGSTVIFTLQLRNLGPNNVSNTIVVTDCLPPGYQYVSNNAVLTGGVYSQGNCQWSLYPGLSSNATVSMSITAIAATGGTYTNTATVAVPNGYTDPNMNNNTASVVVKIYPVYNLSGYVRGCQTNGPAIPFVNVTLSGAASASIFTDTNGFYVFSNLLAGSYTITPASAGNLFSPTNATLTLSSNTTLPVFMGSIGQIRGKLSYGTNGTGIAGTYVKLTGAQTRTALTDANGIYSFTNTPPGNYTVTPVVTNGFVFTPTNAAITIAATNCVGQANFVAQTRTVLLVALEVVQVIQDWNNSVRLIQAKETYVRAHFQLTNNNPVLLQGARLYNGNDSVSPLPSGQLLVAWTNASLRPIREALTNSLNFRLPREWLAGAFSLRFECTNNVTVVPANVVPANSTVQVTFVPAPALPLRLFSVQWTNGGAGGDLQENSAANLADVPRRLLSMYPVPSVDCQMAGPLNMKSPTPPAYVEINAELKAIRTVDAVVSALSRGIIQPPGKRIYHGAVAGAGVGRRDTGIAELPGFIGSGLMPPNDDFYGTKFLRHLATHEIGHNLGRQHTASEALFLLGPYGGPAGGCGEEADPGTVYPLYQTVAGVYVKKPALGPMNSGSNALIFGLDTLTLRTAPQINPVASPYVYFDVMSYCGVNPPSLAWWISTYNYNGMFAYATNTFTPPPGPPAPGPMSSWMLVRGTIDLTLNSAQFLPSIEVTTPVAPDSPPPGPYALVLFDNLGNVIGQVSFQPEVEESEENEDASALFMIPVPANPAIHEMAIWNGTNFVADVVGNTNLPHVNSVSVTATNGGAFSGFGQMNISWTAIDANPNAQLTFMILYSADGGTNWQTLAVDWSGGSYSLDSATLPASGNGVIEVVASDGLNSSAPAFSSLFTVANHPPTVGINSPMNGTIFIADEQVFLDASANDPLDGPLDGSSVQWVSSLDGLLGHGAVLNFEADALSEGRHLITVTATDSLGLTNSASVTITVLRQLPPALSIQLIGSQVLLSWSSSVTNYLLESTTSLSPAAWSTVTNAPVAADITQTVTLNLSSTYRFFRLRLP